MSSSAPASARPGPPADPFLGTSLIFFLTLFGLWRGGDALIKHKIYENPFFAIERLEVETDGVLAAEQIRTWAGVRPKDNLMALDLARVKRDLELVPAIEGVVIERVLPGTLRIRVTEREPIAQILFPRLPNGEGGIYTLDANGCFMFRSPPRALPCRGADQ
jgi:cell division septal protein FtsQ